MNKAHKERRRGEPFIFSVVYSHAHTSFAKLSGHPSLSCAKKRANICNEEEESFLVFICHGENPYLSQPMESPPFGTLP
jgi:hypothetical protein